MSSDSVTPKFLYQGKDGRWRIECHGCRGHRRLYYGAGPHACMTPCRVCRGVGRLISRRAPDEVPA
jgi:hypothetical protein